MDKVNEHGQTKEEAAAWLLHKQKAANALLAYREKLANNKRETNDEVNSKQT